MAGNWGVNAILGLTAFLFTYFFSFVNNTWQTSSVRAGIGFLVFFVFGFFLRFVLQQIVSKKNTNLFLDQNAVGESNTKGEQINQGEEGPIDDPLFQAIPLQALHKGKEA